ncbi:MAG: 2-amino-4-hydroxy-6-hydroxymethyldihydropteridine diphosphokinase [Niabella sp.]
MENKINGIYLLTGTNLGNRQKNLALAKELIAERAGPVIASSAIYETEPWGIPDQPAFYNQVLFLHSTLTAEAVLNVILLIEQEMGRVRIEKYGSRVIDIDILFFNNDRYASEKLVIPHPRIPERNFVLAPMLEIAPDFIHPLLQKTIRQLAAASPDHLRATRLPKS